MMTRSEFLRSVVGLCFAALSAWTTILAFRPSDGFYRAPPQELRGAPGSIIRAEPIAAPPGVRAWRVLYRSLGLKQDSVAVSGIVIASDKAEAGRSVIAWAHPTTGIARRCAPSLSSNIFGSIPGLERMLAAGFVVTATDYAGLGTPGIHPYLVGESAARTVLDSVRAARILTEASNQVAVWGHSQGGHAALWSADLGGRYAPDLKIVGVAAAAPAVDLLTLFRDDGSSPAGELLAGFALLSWSKIYNASLSQMIAPLNRGLVHLMGSQCLTSRFELIIENIALRMIKRPFLKVSPVAAEPWKEIIARNTPPVKPAGMPVLILQGREDRLIPAAVTRQFAAMLCKNGGNVEVLNVDADHVVVARRGADIAVDWLRDRLQGKAVSASCHVP